MLVICFLWTAVNSCTTEKPNNGTESGIQKRQVICGGEGFEYCEGTIEFIPSILRRKIFRYLYIHFPFINLKNPIVTKKVAFKLSYKKH